MQKYGIIAELPKKFTPKSTRIAFQRRTGVRVSPREKREGEVIVVGIGDVCEHNKTIIHKPCFDNHCSKVDYFLRLLRLGC